VGRVSIAPTKSVVENDFMKDRLDYYSVDAWFWTGGKKTIDDAKTWYLIEHYLIILV